MPAFLIGYLVEEVRYRWRIVRETKDAGYTTETVVVNAILAALALAVIAAIALKVSTKANNINLDGGTGT
jgi:hypothetical protein